MLSLVLGAAAAGRAQLVVEPGDSSVAARTVVELGVGVSDPALQPGEAELVLAGHLAETGLRVHVGRTADGDLLDHITWAEGRGGPDVLAVYFVELLDGGQRRLYLFEPETGALWVRELPRTEDQDLLLETLGAMMRGTSSALKDGPPRGMDPVERPEAPPPPPRSLPTEPEPRPDPEPQPRRARFTVALGYLGGNLEGAAPWQSGGVVGVDVELASGATVGLAGGVYAPARTRGTPALNVLRVPIRIAGGYRFRPDAALRPGVGLGLVIEPLRWRASDPAPEVDASDGQTFRLGLAPDFDLRWRLVGGLGLHARVSVDVWLSNADLVVEDGDQRETRFRPHPVAAALDAGLHYTF